jgi:hypothetical protein
VSRHRGTNVVWNRSWSRGWVKPIGFVIVPDGRKGPPVARSGYLESWKMNKKICLVVFPLIISTVLMNDGESAEVNQYQEPKIARFAGNKTTSTPPFTVQGKWQLQWTAEGILGITLYELPEKGPKQRIENTGLSMKDGTGSRNYAKAGNYYLKVTASKAWSIDVVERNPE